MAAGAAALIVLATAGYVVLRQGRHTSESVAIVPIEPLAPATGVAATSVAATGVAATPNPVPPVAVDAAANGPTIQPNGDTVEYQHGVKIIRLGGASLSKTITVPPGGSPPGSASSPTVPAPGRSAPVP